ncbi:MAG: electron transfer flavoprotein subunit alpha/FixB family protein [Gammaproteobacteria bacterium]|nr:electron transfer flavoprotein subunit alpha/FixB family protein [Gammaproteobacteria bacterium]
MVSVLLVAEHDGCDLNPSTARCVSCAASVAGDAVDIAVFADDGQGVAEQAAALAGVREVLLIDRPENAQQLAAVLAPQVTALSAHYSHVLGPSTTFGKDLMPRIAALLGVGQLSDIMATETPYRFERPIYAGNAIVNVEADPETKLVATVRTASYPLANTGGSAQITARALDIDLPQHTRFVELRTDADTSRPDLQSAARVVSGGRGVGSADNFTLVYALADALGAAVGASRAAVDAGYVANDMQVGQTGKIIAPELYVAVGISGAIQHLTGIKDAGTIVAINKDEEAPIFEVADIGLVADLFTALPELTETLKR